VVPFQIGQVLDPADLPWKRCNPAGWSQFQAGREIDLNVHTITGYVLAVALIAPAAGAIAAEQPDQGGPYTGPDDAVMTTASNEITRIGGDSVAAVDDTMLSARDAATSATILANFGRCGTLTFSSNGHDTAMSSKRFADPFSNRYTSFVSHMY
jgi:hypothetical protein